MFENWISQTQFEMLWVVFLRKNLNDYFFFLEQRSPSFPIYFTPDPECMQMTWKNVLWSKAMILIAVGYFFKYIHFFCWLISSINFLLLYGNVTLNLVVCCVFSLSREYLRNMWISSSEKICIESYLVYR